MITFAEAGHTLAVGFPLSDVAIPTASVGTVYGVAQIASAASSSVLSNDLAYPYFSRVAAAPSGYPEIIKETLLYYNEQAGRGWTNVGVISAVSSFVNNIASTFIEIAEPEIEIATFQQFLVEQGVAGDLDVEFGELKRCGARVFLALIFDNWQGFMKIADSYGLVGENYVWIAPPSIVGVPFPEPNPLLQGSIGAVFAVRDEDDPILQDFRALWSTLDPNEYIAAGPDYPIGGSFAFIAYDMGIAAAMAIDVLEREGKLDDPNVMVTAEDWNRAIRSLRFEGLSNTVSFKPNGDRIGKFNLQYYSASDNKWFTAAKWTVDDGFQPVSEIVWYSNTTDIPDLDIREPFHYWSCEEKKMKYDPTGKTIEIHTPNADSNVDDIDSNYHCDHFIDCHNMSDESSDCSSDFIIVFIVFGIITGLLVLLCVLLIVFVIVFGLCLKYRRLRVASPFFLILILLSMIVGYISIYSWFGKPNTIACNFQPWLLGISVNSMITALSVKNFRIWRIFRFPSRKLKISNFELFFLWSIFMIPAIIILILWTSISTPTASMEERDGEDHYVCNTGGATGEPGGLIFFFIFVAYTSFILLIGAVVSILTRNVPSQFNETTLLTVSIYNLGFLAAVIIPVFLVVNPFNPFIAWILRTCAILYAFTATMFLQFVPIIFGIFLLDKGKNVKHFKSAIKMTPSDSTTTKTGNDSKTSSITNSAQ